MPDLFGLAQHGRDSLFADGIKKLTTYSQKLGGTAEHLTAAEQREAEDEFQRQSAARETRKDEGKRSIDEEYADWRDIYGEGGGEKPKVKAAFVWHIMFAAFALITVMLVGYLSKQNMAKRDASAADDIPMGAANNLVPKPTAPATGPGAQGRDLDEEKFRLLAKMIGSMESKPAPITFQIDASGQSGEQAQALNALASYNIQPKRTATARRPQPQPGQGGSGRPQPGQGGGGRRPQPGQGAPPIRRLKGI